MTMPKLYRIRVRAGLTPDGDWLTRLEGEVRRYYTNPPITDEMMLIMGTPKEMTSLKTYLYTLE